MLETQPKERENQSKWWCHDWKSFGLWQVGKEGRGTSFQEIAQPPLGTRLLDRKSIKNCGCISCGDVAPLTLRKLHQTPNKIHESLIELHSTPTYGCAPSLAIWLFKQAYCSLCGMVKGPKVCSRCIVLYYFWNNKRLWRFHVVHGSSVGWSLSHVLLR